jgi:general secretion pathway protein A
VYRQFFEFADEPFRLTPDPRYLFLSRKHAEALAHLRLGLTESSGFVCITGEIGTGKTTLLRAFLAELGPGVTAAYALTPPDSATDLLRRICRELGVPSRGESKVELLEALHAHLIAETAAGRVCVVVLDEAQALSAALMEEIRLLLNLETETKKLLRIVLVGQPQLRKLLLDPALAQLNQRITLRWHLEALSYGETVAYVRHRLEVASEGPAQPLFTKPALRLLYSVSGGVPRLINMIAHRALLVAFVAREPRVRRAHVARAYSELQAVPLPGTLTPARKGALATTGLAVGVSLAVFGMPQLDGLYSSPAPDAVRAAPSRQPAVEPASAPAASAPVAAPVRETAARSASAAELAERLARIGVEASARAATATILSAWGESPVVPAENRLPDDLRAVAWQRRLETLQLTANRSMLRLLDLPAVVTLRVPEGDPYRRRDGDVRYAALTGMREGQVVLSIDGAPLTIDPELFDRAWTGQAHILWRDADGFGATLGLGTRGIGVVHLQERLRREGTYGGKITGTFDAETARAVLDFQRVHRLETDGLVGPLTRIVLYATAPDRPRPELASSKGTAS